MILLILFWVFLTLNSVFGLIFFEKTDGFGDNIETLVLFILNFYVSNILAYFCILKSPLLKIVNVALGFLGLALLVLILESAVVYVLIYEMLNLEGIVALIIFVILWMLTIVYGGIRQILIKMFNCISISQNY